MTRYNFHEIAIHGQKSGKCACGKRRTRREKFWQTINPFNKNVAGTPKTQAEIRAELLVERAEWLKAPITCDACAPRKLAASPPTTP